MPSARWMLAGTIAHARGRASRGGYSGVAFPDDAVGCEGEDAAGKLALLEAPATSAQGVV